MLTPITRRHLAAGAAALALTLGASCSSSIKQSVAIESVDSLVSRVEHVHLEAELAKQSVYETLISLGPLMAPEFKGDAAAAMDRFAEATAACEAQAEDLRQAIKPMRASADTVFTTWTKSLDDFTSPRMRDRSQRRLDATKQRFADVQEAAMASQESLDALVVQFRDMVLYLGHDFNAGAVAEIREDALTIRDASRGLGTSLDRCMDAAAIYVENSALRGQVEAEVTETTEGQ